MDTEHMREAITLAESGSFSRAASKLFMTQSSLSRHVSALERELGMALFDRTASGVEATEAGQVVIDAFGESEAILSQAIEKAKRIVNPEAVVTVGGCLSNDYAVAVLVEATNRLRRAGMASCVRFVDTGTRDYADRLADGEVDIVIAPRYGIAHGSDLRFRHLADVPFVCMMDAQNPLASKNSSGGGAFFRRPFRVHRSNLRYGESFLLSRLVERFVRGGSGASRRQGLPRNHFAAYCQPAA